MSDAYLDQLVEDAGIVELRVQTEHGFASRLFDCADRLRHALHNLGERQTAYTTLNRPMSSFRANERVSLKDADIHVVTRIVFDLDPIRPKGTASTQAELNSALKVRDELVALLAGAGWPLPALGISGNGTHVMYRARLWNIPVWRKASAELYLGLRSQLADICRDAGVQFDTSVRNPSRIWRIYGRLNCKGESTPERPHRMAAITLPAGAWQPVPAATIAETTRIFSSVVRACRRPDPAPFHGKVDYRTLDIVGWFQAHDHYRRALEPGKHAVRCPWEQEHSTPADARDRGTVVWESGDSGWPTFHCAHNHCEGRQLIHVIALWGDAEEHCARSWRRDHG